MMTEFSTPRFVAQMVVLFFAIGLHEYAHCKFADMAGDPTPSYYGRVTLNLFKHFEPMGTLMIILTSLSGYGIGWGRAAIANPSKMRNPRWDWFISVAAGPVSNIVQATIYAFLFRYAVITGWFDGLGADDLTLFFKYWIFYGVAINLGLAIFNLIPFGPLDGHWLVGLLLPEKARYYWFRFNKQVGMPGLFVVVLYLQWQHIALTQGPVSFCFRALTGKDFIQTYVSLAVSNIPR